MYSRADGKVEKLAKQVIREYFPNLRHIKILFVFRKKPKPGDDGMIIAGQAKPLSAKLRDIYGYDAEIELARPVWNVMNGNQRKRLLWHELNHLEVQVDEDSGEVEKDKEGRIIVYGRDHDLVLKTFREEISRFGMTKEDLSALKFLHKVYLRWKKGKVRIVKPIKLEDMEVDFG